jgi:hypothetical protein
MHDLTVKDGAPAGELLANGLRQRSNVLNAFRLRDTSRQAPPST